jgi:hypothetical protein
MRDERDELLDEIGAALSIEPTPEFAAKVRGEVRTVRQASFLRPHGLAGATVVAACIAIAAVALRHETVPLTSGPVRTSRAAPEATSVERRAEAASEAVPARPTVRSERAGPVQNRVIFAAEEVEAFWRLAAAAQADHLTIPPERWSINSATGEIALLPEIAAIELPAVTIELLPGTVSDDKAGGTDD